MKKIILLGIIEAEYDLLIKAIKEVELLNSEKVIPKIKMFEEIRYEDEIFNFLIYGYEHEDFIFSCKHKGTIEEIIDLANQLVESLQKNNIEDFTFDYNEEDEEGNIIGEEYEIRSGIFKREEGS